MSDPRLQALYDQVPVIHCTGGCAEACSMIPVGRAELVELRAAAGRRLRTVEVDIPQVGAVLMLKPDATPYGPRCPLLVDGRCSTYEARPMICRMFGAARGFICPRGCQPSRYLTREEAHRLIAEARSLR